MPKSKPVHEVRLGSIKAAVWKNNTPGGARHNVTFRRIYKKDDQWSSTDSFGRDDLLLLAKVADQAHSWITTWLINGGGRLVGRHTPSASILDQRLTPPTTKFEMAVARVEPHLVPHCNLQIIRGH